MSRGTQEARASDRHGTRRLVTASATRLRQRKSRRQDRRALIRRSALFEQTRGAEEEADTHTRRETRKKFTRTPAKPTKCHSIILFPVCIPRGSSAFPRSSLTLPSSLALVCHTSSRQTLVGQEVHNMCCFTGQGSAFAGRRRAAEGQERMEKTCSPDEEGGSGACMRGVSLSRPSPRAPGDEARRCWRHAGEERK